MANYPKKPIQPVKATKQSIELTDELLALIFYVDSKVTELLKLTKAHEIYHDSPDSITLVVDTRKLILYTYHDEATWNEKIKQFCGETKEDL